MGVWAAFYTHNINKNTKRAFLRDFFLYIIFINLDVLLYQIFEYLYMNILGRDLSNLHPYLSAIFYLVALIIQIGITWTFIRVFIGLQGKSVSRRIKQLFYAGIAFIGISYTVGITLYIQTTSSKWIDSTLVYFMYISWGIIYAAILLLTLRKHPMQEPGKRKAIQAFGTLYLLYYSAFFISNILPAPMSLYIMSGIRFCSNLIPLFWIRQYFLKHFVTLSYAQVYIDLDKFSKEFHISKREREIAELILQGKSNKEIEDVLFISFNTVKNHIYNLYQKLGVNSRGQLVHFIQEVLKK
jgi:DNA-binding CsgD family transcriptional regulator